jgi:hypothetical protein
MPRNAELISNEGGAVHPSKGGRHNLHVVLEHFTTLGQAVSSTLRDLKATSRLHIKLTNQSETKLFVSSCLPVSGTGTNYTILKRRGFSFLSKTPHFS